MNSFRKYKRVVLDENGAARHETNRRAVALALLVSSFITLAVLGAVSYFRHC